MRRIKLINFAIFVAVCFVMLVIIEIGLEMFYPQTNKVTFLERGAEDNFDPVVGWTGYRDSIFHLKSTEFENFVYVNTEGFPDENWPMVKNNSEKRIIALGDSYTAGVEVHKYERFTEKIEEFLNADYKEYSFSVLNFGVGGYSTCNHFLVLTNKSLKYNPDVAILFFYIGNDFDEDFDSASERPKCNFDDDGKLISYERPSRTDSINNNNIDLFNFLIRKTNVGSLFMNAIRYSHISYRMAKAINRKPSFDVIDLFDPRLFHSNKRALEQTLFTVKGIDVFLKEKKIPFIVMIIPHRLQIQSDTWNDIITKYEYNESDYNLLLPNRYMINYLEKEDIKYFDFYDSFMLTYESLNEPLYYYHNGHLNVKGHEIAAKVTYGLLKDKGFLNIKDIY